MITIGRYCFSPGTGPSHTTLAGHTYYSSTVAGMTSRYNGTMMLFTSISWLFAFIFFIKGGNSVRTLSPREDRTSVCFNDSLPSKTPSDTVRTTPWGTSSVHFSSLNGTLSTCCESLDDVRLALDEIDTQLLQLLNRRLDEAFYILLNFSKMQA